MTDVSKAREDARKRTGKFGLGVQSTPEVTVNEEERLWGLELEYNDGLIEVIQVKPSGKLVKPHRSDRLTLIYLVGFKAQQFGRGADLDLDEALADPGAVTGFFPMFDTTDDSTTTVFGRVKSLIEL